MSTTNLTTEQLLAELRSRKINVSVPVASFIWNGKTYSGETFANLADQMREDGIDKSRATLSERLAWLASGCWGITLADIEVGDEDPGPSSPIDDETHALDGYNHIVYRWVNYKRDKYGSFTRRVAYVGVTDEDSQRPYREEGKDYDVEILAEGLTAIEAGEIEAYQINKYQPNLNTVNEARFKQARNTMNRRYTVRYFDEDGEEIWNDSALKNKRPDVGNLDGFYHTAHLNNSNVARCEYFGITIDFNPERNQR